MYHNKSALTLHAKFVGGPMRDMGRLDMAEAQPQCSFFRPLRNGVWFLSNALASNIISMNQRNGLKLKKLLCTKM